MCCHDRMNAEKAKPCGRSSLREPSVRSGERLARLDDSQSVIPQYERS